MDWRWIMPVSQVKKLFGICTVASEQSPYSLRRKRRKSTVWKLCCLLYTSQELLAYGRQVKNPYLRGVIEYYFEKNEAFIKTFKGHSAAKTVHHGFAGGLLEHTLSVVKFCEYMVSAYPILNKDLLYTAAMCHDIGKTKELSALSLIHISLSSLFHSCL